MKKSKCLHAYVIVGNMETNRCIYCGTIHKLTLRRMVTRKASK